MRQTQIAMNNWILLMYGLSICGRGLMKFESLASDVPAARPHVVCLLSPAQSHIGATLKLAKLLHSKGFHITFVSTEFNHRRMIDARGGPGFLDYVSMILLMSLTIWMGWALKNFQPFTGPLTMSLLHLLLQAMASYSRRESLCLSSTGLVFALCIFIFQFHICLPEGSNRFLAIRYCNVNMSTYLIFPLTVYMKFYLQISRLYIRVSPLWRVPTTPWRSNC